MKQLVEKGLQPKNLIETAEGYSEKVIFPAALVFYKGRELPVMLLQEQLNKGPQETLNNSIALLEYQIANAIQKIQRKEKPTLGFLTGHGELDSKFLESMAVELAQYYFLERYNVTENLYIPPKFSSSFNILLILLSFFFDFDFEIKILIEPPCVAIFSALNIFVLKLSKKYFKLVKDQ